MTALQFTTLTRLLQFTALTTLLQFTTLTRLQHSLKHPEYSHMAAVKLASSRRTQPRGGCNLPAVQSIYGGHFTTGTSGGALICSLRLLGCLWQWKEKGVGSMAEYELLIPQFKSYPIAVQVILLHTGGRVTFTATSSAGHTPPQTGPAGMRSPSESRTRSSKRAKMEERGWWMATTTVLPSPASCFSAFITCTTTKT